jgi:O-antigen ligase
LQAAVLLCLPLGLMAGLALHQRGYLDGLLDYVLPALLLILILWGLLQGPNTFTTKPQGPFNDPNTYAGVLNLLLLPILARYLATDLAKQAAWLRIGQLALLAGVAFVSFLTASRGATLALLLVLPPLLWLARKKPDFIRKLALLATVSLVAYLFAVTINGGLSVAKRLVDTVQGGDTSRLMLLKSAWSMIQGHPWLGTGLGTFRLLYPRYRYRAEADTAGGWVHNDYLQLWLEAGLPMLLLMLGLVAWVVWAGWRTLRDGGEDALPRMGYLIAIAAVLLHALVNFMFFFALVSLLVGLYLARVVLPFAKKGQGEDLNHQDTSACVEKSPPAPPLQRGGLAPPKDHIRAIRLAVGGYALVLGWLLLGQVAVEGFLNNARPIQQVFSKWNVAYPLYQVSYWLTVLTPFHPTPQQIMGLELASLSGGGGAMRDEALSRMEAGWQRAPCYLPYANDALVLIQQGSLDARLRARGQAIVARNLECNPRHGLSYYYAGNFATSPGAAQGWWRTGLAASPYLGDRIMLATAILSRTTPGHEKELTALAEQMAQAIRNLEASPGIHPDQEFWSTAQHTLYRLAGRRFLELVQPPKR